MTEELHRQRVLNFLEVFYSGDIEGALARCTDDVDFFSNAPVDILPHMGHRHGQAEMRETWQTIHARYSSMRHEVPIIVAEGDKVAAMIRVFFRKRKNNRIVQFAPRGLLHFSQRAHCADPRGHGHLRSGRTGARARRRRRLDRQEAGRVVMFARPHLFLSAA